MGLAVTKTLTKEIDQSIQVLLGRGKTAFPCPLEPGELVTFWENTFDPSIVQSFHRLSDAGFNMIGLSWDSAAFMFETDHYYSVKFVRDSPAEKTRSFIIRSNMNFEVGRLITAMGNAKWAEFTVWCEHCATIERDFTKALRTLEAVLEFCGTVGQLKRAVPDLINYLPRKIQNELADQTRPSNMPHEWAGFTRARIDDLQTCMAKAHLMPAQVGAKRWDEIFNTWASYV